MSLITALFLLVTYIVPQKQIEIKEDKSMLDYIIKYMKDNGHTIFTNTGELNIVYVEGMNPDMTLNSDTFNEWNDTRLVFTYINDCPELIFTQLATTEPGKLATFSRDSIARKGAARIAFGQYTAWKIGYHKISTNRRNHPALIQCSPLPIHRDLNRDGARTGDIVYTGMFGINQHGTRIGYSDKSPIKVENWSEGCLVGKDWNKHLQFINLLKQDPRFKSNPNFIFTTTIIPGDKIKIDQPL